MTPRPHENSLESIRFEEPLNGYAPREDSWLLARHLSHASGHSCLDMGTGSGIQAAALLLQGASRVTCVDINPHALTTAKKMIEYYFPSSIVNYVSSFLFEAIPEKFDVIVFNPPYVPSDTIQWVETDGGKKGREIIDRFLQEFPAHLNPGGVVFLLQSSLNGIFPTQKKLRAMGFTSRILAREKLAFEELLVFKITRAKNSI